MGMTGLLLALTLVGLDSARRGARGGDRHCDYTRPGVEPWWTDLGGEAVDPPSQAGLAADHSAFEH